MINQEEGYQFIEVKRVVSDGKGGKNVGSNLEMYPISDIHTARPWHKGKNDEYIQGDMTLLVISPERKDPFRRANIENGKAIEEVQHSEPKMRTILIEEGFDSFVNRLNRKAPVNRILANE